jgi:hypothetical protein
MERQQASVNQSVSREIGQSTICNVVSVVTDG